MKEFEATGITVDDAIKTILEEKKLKREDIEVTVIDSGSKGILGFNKRPAKILVHEIFNPQLFAENFFQKIIANIGLKADVITKFEDNNLSIELVGEDAKFFIGRYGSILDSFQQILSFSIRKHMNIKINIDAEGYRLKQKEKLEHFALNAAKKVLHTHVKFVFKPMSSYERLVIHQTLQDMQNVITYSEGEKENRHVVVDYKE